MCARHIFANLKKRHGSADPLHKLFWKCARAYNKHVFEKNLEKMKTVKIDAYEQVKKSVNSNWSRHFSVTLQSRQLLKTILASLTMLS